jgi:hypothetical protein
MHPDKHGLVLGIRKPRQSSEFFHQNLDFLDPFYPRPKLHVILFVRLPPQFPDRPLVDHFLCIM